MPATMPLRSLAISAIAAVLSAAALGACAQTSGQADAEAVDFHAFAPTPPMGWNSWDIFGTSVTERQVREQALAMREHLLDAGYDVLTVDIQWYEPNAQGHYYNPDAVLTMDGFGRLQPAVNRFPTAADGSGFTELAEFVHDQGLRFGIHIMRGIPRQAVEQDLPIFGTDGITARDIANTNSWCPWNPDMYGVDMSQEGAQAYYDSLINMYASWGVDFIKVDDISRPYDENQLAEIEALRSAIDRCGRDIVLSLSPGATPLEAGDHVNQHANMWRITDDFWDRWGLLHAMFERLHAWTPYRREGAWPDADMLPLGIIDFNRRTNFTIDEQRTLMTLWCIGRSPLIFGGDMTRLDRQTLDMLTNPEVLAVNQHSDNNRQLSREDDLIVWVAEVPDSDDYYVALFNAQSRGDEFDFDAAQYTSPVISGNGNSVEISINCEGAERLILFVRDGGNGFEYDHAVWVEPTLYGGGGRSLALTRLEWAEATCGWGEARVDRTCEDQPLIVGGEEVSGIGTHSNSVIVYNVPAGYERFEVTGVLTNNGSVEFGVLVDTGANVGETPDQSEVSINFADLGITGEVRVRDLWAREDLGTFEGSFGRDLPLHGAGLYRISPAE